MQPAIFSLPRRRLQHKQAQALSRRIIYLLPEQREGAFRSPVSTLSCLILLPVAPRSRATRRAAAANYVRTLQLDADSSAPDGNLDAQRGKQLATMAVSSNFIGFSEK
jgi:hypothetical protein